jgi:sirohydrochlorin cobaltochelatase
MLILVAHGSSNARWRDAVEQLAAAVQAEVGENAVRLAYMDCSPEAARAGVREIRVLPLFLVSEGHVERDIRPLVDEVRRVHQAVNVVLLPPLGHYRQFRELICDIAMDRAP